jgi:hypothetical protein
LTCPRSREHARALGVNLKLEAVTGEVVALLRAAAIPTIVLKGASVIRWLYADDPRTSTDVDLLVPPSKLTEAETVLAQYGFRAAHGDEHAHEWVRPRDGMVVDLHDTVVGFGLAPDELWRGLVGETEPMRIGGHDTDVLRAPARALHLALHASQHGVEVGAALDDLRRALERLPEDTWREAAGLAERLRATPAFAAGLRLTPQGAEVAERLGLPVQISAEIALRARTPPPVALGLQQLAATRGLRRKLAFLASELAPPPPFMRARFGFARRGRIGLAAAYAWRPVWLVWHTGPALLAWERARRESRATRG